MSRELGALGLGAVLPDEITSIISCSHKLLKAGQFQGSYFLSQ
jgi:hypothetical protein